jgi:hypothetical protein
MALARELFADGNHTVIVTNVAAWIRVSCLCVPMNSMKSI